MVNGDRDKLDCGILKKKLSFLIKDHFTKRDILVFPTDNNRISIEKYIF